jgi:hypothetical protein
MEGVLQDQPLWCLRLKKKREKQCENQARAALEPKLQGFHRASRPPGQRLNRIFSFLHFNACVNPNIKPAQTRSVRRPRGARKRIESVSIVLDNEAGKEHLDGWITSLGQQRMPCGDAYARTSGRTLTFESPHYTLFFARACTSRPMLAPARLCLCTSHTARTSPAPPPASYAHPMCNTRSTFETSKCNIRLKTYETLETCS